MLQLQSESPVRVHLPEITHMCPVTDNGNPVFCPGTEKRRMYAAQGIRMTIDGREHIGAIATNIPLVCPGNSIITPSVLDSTYDITWRNGFPVVYSTTWAKEEDNQ